MSQRPASSSSITSSVSEDHYIHQLATYIRVNSERLSATAASARRQGQDGQSTWTSTLLLTSNPLKPLTLTLSLYHLYYILLKIQGAGFADVGDLDVPLQAEYNRRPPALFAEGNNDKSDARSVRTGWSLLSAGASSFGSGWWGASAPSSSNNPATILEKNLRLIYTAFTILPSLRIVMRDDEKGKHKEVEGFPFGEYPGDRMLPLKAFKSLQRLEIQGIDARVLLYTQEWSGLRVLQVRNSGTEDLTELLQDPESRREWCSTLGMLDVEENDITNIDGEDLVGLERLHSLSLKKNLLIAVPTALANLTSLRALDLSDNMIDSVLAIYKALPALTLLNLRSNRISSLCGLERLLSLQTLDIRSNNIYDASELTRLVTLPHLKEIYVCDGNPFVEDPKAISGNGWRIDLFNAFLREASGSLHGRNRDNLLSIDGFPPSWNEKRFLVEASHSGFASLAEHGNRSNRSRHPTANGHRHSQHVEPAHTIVSPRRSRQPSSSSIATQHTSRTAKAFSSSPPPPVPALPSALAAGTAKEPAGEEGASKQAKPKIVKRKHRRVVDLDGDSGNNRPTSAEAFRKHDRAASSPGTPSIAEDQESILPPNSDCKRYHTVSSHPSIPSKSRSTSSRKLSENTFAQPGVITSDVPSGSGSEAEDFRKKMEKLRDEVGVENWLSVYASANQTGSSSRTPAATGKVDSNK